MTLEVIKICRTCLGSEGNLLSIYQTKGFSNVGNVSDMITELTDLRPDKSDGFPENVCLECIREINRCYTFKLKCEHSYSTLKQILIENSEKPQVESKIEPKTKNQTPNSELKILEKTIISAPSNNFNKSSAQTESKTENSSYSVLYSNNQSKKEKKLEVEPEKDELMSDSFEMMIEKMIFEDEVDCVDTLNLKPMILYKMKDNHLENREPKKVIKMEGEYSPHKIQSKLEPQVSNNDDIQINYANEDSENSDYQAEKKNAIEDESNAKKEDLLESSLFNESEDKGEYKIHLSCESLNFKSDITIRKSPKKKESSFPCATCGKVFTLLSSLHNHMLIHNEQRPYSCKYCGKTFRNKSTHKLHELRHNKNKPFKCEECKNSFVCLKELKTHLLVHKDEYPYVCAICTKEFRYANALKSHIRIHTGEKPYACTHCPKKYAQLTSLTTHHNGHTDKGLSIKEMNECKYCKRFLYKKKQKHD